MVSISARPAGPQDLPLLAQMNKRLIEDEGSRNPMSLTELERRMAGFVSDGWQVRLFHDHGNPEVLGYAVYQLRSDKYAGELRVVYLRQLYIERAFRGRGLGAQAVNWLIEHEFPAGCRVVIDVLATNPRGEAFWQRMGFQPYYINMQLETRENSKNSNHP